MKTAVSMPDELFEQVERLAEKAGKSRSQVYREALSAYIAAQEGSLTDRMNAAVDHIGEDGLDEWGQEAARRVFERSEWE